METKNEWVFFEEIDWNDPENNRLAYNFTEKNHEDYNTLKKEDGL